MVFVRGPGGKCPRNVKNMLRCMLFLGEIWCTQLNTQMSNHWTQPHLWNKKVPKTIQSTPPPLGNAKSNRKPWWPISGASMVISRMALAPSREPQTLFPKTFNTFPNIPDAQYAYFRTIVCSIMHCLDLFGQTIGIVPHSTWWWMPQLLQTWAPTSLLTDMGPDPHPGRDTAPRTFWWVPILGPNPPRTFCSNIVVGSSALGFESDMFLTCLGHSLIQTTS